MSIIDSQGKVFENRESDSYGVAATGKDGFTPLNDTSVNKPFHKNTNIVDDKNKALKTETFKAILDTWVPSLAYDKDLYNPNGSDQGEHIAMYNELKKSGYLNTSLPGIQSLPVGQNANRNPLNGAGDSNTVADLFNDSNAYGKNVIPQ